MLDHAKHLNLEVTNCCNLNCVYCFNNSGNHNRNKEQEITYWLNFLKTKLNNNGLQSILVTGGEPFMWPCTVDLLDAAQRMGLKTSILSNGYKVPELALKHTGVFKNLLVAQISLDSMDPQIHDLRRGVKGAWFKAMDAIDIFISLNVPVEISCTISKENLDEFDKVGSYCKSIGAAFLARPLACTGRAKSSLLTPILEEQLHALCQSALSDGIALIPDRFEYAPDFFNKI